MIIIRCECGETYQADHQHAGKWIRCHSCGRALYIVPPSLERLVTPRQVPSSRGARRWRDLWGDLMLWLPIACVVLLIAAIPWLASRDFLSKPSSGSERAEQKKVSEGSLKPLVGPTLDAGMARAVSELARASRSAPPRLRPVRPARPRRPPVSLPTGTLIFRSDDPGDFGSLTVQNGTSLDGVIKLRDESTGRAIVAVYVQRRHTFTVTDVPGIRCILQYTLGLDWDQRRHRFRESASYQRFDDILDFQTVRDDLRVTYHNYTVTLHQVPYGNATTSELSAQDFDAP